MSDAQMKRYLKITKKMNDALLEKNWHLCLLVWEW
jgi:hypothetical protein